MSSLSDPGRPSRGERRNARKLIDAAYASGQLSAAERSLRAQRADAAHTRGDLAMITHDLAASPPSPGDAPSLGSAIDPQVLRSMKVAGTYRGTDAGASPLAKIHGNLPDLAAATRTVRLVIVIVAVVVLGFCGLGVFAFIPAFVDGFDSGPTSSPTAVPTEFPTAPGSATGGDGDAATIPSLHSAAGWRALVDAIEQKSGSTSVYDLVVYPTYASVGLDGGKYVERGLYRDGAWQESFNVRTPIVGKPLDLRAIDPAVIAKLPAETAQRLGVESPTGTYFIVNAILSAPKIMVYVQADGGSQYQAYTLDGTPRAP